MAEDNILSYIDQLNPTSALIGASNRLLNMLQGAGVVPRVDGSYAPKRTNTGERSRGSRRGTGLRSRQEQGAMYGTLPPSVNQNLGAYDESVTLPNVGSAGNAGGYNPIRQNQSFDSSGSSEPSYSPRDRAYVEEVSRLAQQAQTDPYFQQMQQYKRQGKQAVGSGNQAQMDAVRDLGLAINAAKFGTPEQRMQQTVGRFNPQMAGMPGYPATREAFEQQRPFIAPEEEARIDAMDMASQALQRAMQGQAGTQFPTQALGVMQRPAGVSPNTSVFAGPQAGQAGFNTSATMDFSVVPEEAKAEFLKRLQSSRPM